MIVELEKITDLRGFQHDRISILNLSNYHVYVCQSLGGAVEGWWAPDKIGVQGLFWWHHEACGGFASAAPDLLCLMKFVPHFILIFSPKLLHRFLRKARHMLLWSLYLRPYVQITAIRLLTCELKLFKTKRSAFIIGPGALKEGDNTEFTGVTLRDDDNSESSVENELMCTYRE